jgi:hypothetical protein
MEKRWRWEEGDRVVWEASQPLTPSELRELAALVRDGEGGRRAAGVEVRYASRDVAERQASAVEFAGARATAGGDAISSGARFTTREDFGIE